MLVGSMLKLSRNSPVLAECCIWDCTVLRLKEGEPNSLSSLWPYVMERFWMKVVLPLAGAPACIQPQTTDKDDQYPVQAQQLLMRGVRMGAENVPCSMIPKEEDTYLRIEITRTTRILK